ncbi:DUF732 domain-containing protein [Mycobacterium sp. SMC-11]|uniref:DUF732 domain-containing protein n=1 Tax=Mycobacterium sp. SMC-11 TaxID=3385969 RepID=UPI00390C9388
MRTTTFHKFLTASLAVAATALVVAPAAQADAHSYQQYLRDNGINIGIMAMTPGSEVGYGLNVCKYLRAGMTVDEVIPMGWNSMADNPAMVNAAQRELCPETLR